MKKNMRTGLILSLLLLFIGGCSFGGSETKEAKNNSSSNYLNVAIVSEPPSLDPATAKDNTSSAVVRNVFEGMTRITSENKVEKAAAEKIDVSEDGLTYTFTLRDSKWSNGDPLTAEDFEYAWKRALNPETLSEYASILYPIKGAEEYNKNGGSIDNVEVHALDEKTLEVVLEEPTPYFDQLTSFFTYYPVNKKIVEKNSNWATNSGEDYVSNGAFTLSSWKHDDSIQLKKNDNYWGKDTVNLDEVTIKMIEEESTANKMFEAGELDFLGAPFQLVPLDAVEGYKASNQLKTPKYAATYFLRVGVTKEFVSNKNIRKALALAIDRDNIVTNIVKSGQTVATGFIPPTIDGFESNSGYFKDNDVEEAKKHLKLGMDELGIENASDITIDINISSSEINDAIAQVIQEDWTKNLGIKAAISNSELKVFLDKISSLDYSGVASSTWIADYLDGYTFLEIFNSKTNGNNRTGWENEEYTSLLDASNKEQNYEKRLVILKEAEALLMDEMPIIPIFYSTSTNVVKDYVSDMQSNALGELYLKEVKVDRK